MSNDTMPENFDQAYPGRFLKAGHFPQPRTLTINRLFHESLEGERGAQKKLVVEFKETEFQLVLCKLNGTAIKGMFGSQLSNWLGRRITFYSTDQIMPMPNKTGADRFCIRVFGSPDIEEDMAVTFAPPKRKAMQLRLKAMKDETAKPNRSQLELDELASEYIGTIDACTSDEQVRELYKDARKAGIAGEQLKRIQDACTKRIAAIKEMVATPEEPTND